MESNPRHFMWIEKYRPSKIADCILPASIKGQFQAIVDSGVMTNLILAGRAGIGKTTVARALGEDMDRDVLFKNASEQGNIDTLRYEIRNFASTMSFSGKPKIVIFDEGDYLNSNSTQPALRGFMEEFAVNCNFIFTCNQKGRLIEPIRESRCSIIDFVIPKEEKATLARLFFTRCKEIMEQEKIVYEPSDLTRIVLQYFPDFRKTLNELQKFSATGTLTIGDLSMVGDSSIKELVSKMVEKDMGFVRTWVAQNADNDPGRIMTKMYHALYDKLEPQYIPDAITTIAKYQHWSITAASQEINLMACICEITALCQFKK